MIDKSINDYEYCAFDTIITSTTPPASEDEGYFIENDSMSGFPFHCHSQGAVRPGVTTNPHIHEFIEILYCTKGEYRVTVNGKCHRLRSDEMIIVNSREIHEAYAVEVPARYTVIKFSPKLLSSTRKNIFEYKYMLPFTMESDNIVKLFTREMLEGSNAGDAVAVMLKEYTEKQYGYEMAIRGELCSLFLWILRRWKKDGTSISTPVDISENILAKLNDVFEYIEKNISSEVSLDTAAELCGFSVSHFSRVFKKTVGENFSDYLNSRRIVEAQRLIATTDMNVTEIAMECGFSSASYFIKRFRDKTGISPRKYRERINE